MGFALKQLFALLVANGSWKPAWGFVQFRGQKGQNSKLSTFKPHVGRKWERHNAKPHKDFL
jgi:hypothetical protein